MTITQTMARETPPERRDDVARRFKTFWPTSLRTATDVRRAHVLNVSRSGAKLHAQNPIDPGQVTEVEIGGAWLGGVVRWRRGPAFGIAFHEPLPDAVLQGYLDQQDR